MDTRETLAMKHNFMRETIFHLKSSLLTCKRTTTNLLNGTKKFPQSDQLMDMPVLSISESELWNKDDNKDNWILTAGKIENLRIAARSLHGIVIPAGEIFSFWKQVGKLTPRKGYVPGRELREGCIVPSTGGGICQLSNAIYDAACKAGFEILERHKHTKVIKGSLAEQNRDATVKWNYIDLRFRATVDFRIEIDMTANKCIVILKGEKPERINAQESKDALSPWPLNDCYSCYNTICYICNAKEKIQDNNITTYILDEHWKEYEAYVNEHAREDDVIIVPFLTSQPEWYRNQQNAWTITKGKVKTFTLPALQRLISFRRHKRDNLFVRRLIEDEKLVNKISKMIPVESTRLVIAQNLLPFLHKQFITGGRHYDVLMTQTPIRQLQKELDVAYGKYNRSPTLNDFRAPESLIILEEKSLERARNLITPHEHIARLYKNITKLDWLIDKEPLKKKGKKILFPGSMLARKGGYEMQRLAKELNLVITVTGRAIEKPGFLDGIQVQKVEGNYWENTRLVIYPVYIESHPKQLIKAIESGIPVITTETSGLKECEGVTIVPTGDYEALKNAVINLLDK